MANKTIEPHEDDVEEIEETAKQQTEQEFDLGDLDAAASRVTVDRFHELLDIMTRPRRLGSDLGLSDDVRHLVDEALKAGALLSKRVYEADLPRERITNWD